MVKSIEAIILRGWGALNTGYPACACGRVYNYRCCRMLAHGRLDAHLGSQNIFWCVDQAMVAVERRDCACLKV
jgi:hypothetical protein